MIGTMTAVLYPVAENAEQAMTRPMGRAVREREARGVTAQAVVFTTDPVGPAFATREAAVEAYAGPLSENWARLVEQILPGQTLAHAEPSFKDGRRWPEASASAPRTAWRLMVSYWRIATAERPVAAPQARKARREGRDLDAETLRAIAQEPLRPIEPQRALDIGLFEVRPPNAPHILIPDE